MINTTRNVAELEIEDIEGIGPTTARKMKDAGVSSVMEACYSIPNGSRLQISAGLKETAAYLYHRSAKAA